MTYRELLQEALESIKWLRVHLERDHACLHMKPAVSGIPDWLNKTEASLRARLAQPEQEPVAWCIVENDRVHGLVKSKPAVMNAEKWQPLYTVPPQREWVGLTGEELQEIYQSAGTVHFKFVMVEAKLREKNT